MGKPHEMLGIGLKQLGGSDRDRVTRAIRSDGRSKQVDWGPTVGLDPAALWVSPMPAGGDQNTAVHSNAFEAAGASRNMHCFRPAAAREESAPQVGCIRASK